LKHFIILRKPLVVLLALVLVLDALALALYCVWPWPCLGGLDLSLDTWHCCPR